MALFKPVLTPADLPPTGTSRETGTFDFKGRQEPSEQRELAKDVAALANATGGVVLVGAQEDKNHRTLGIYTPIKTVQEAEALTTAYELAVTQRCVPQPVIEVVRIDTIPGVHPPGYVVAVNVYAAPLGPIGVRWDGAEAFGFPLRTATQTHWMTPTELSMLMVPEIRRAMILLDEIPPAERQSVRLFHNRLQGPPGIEVLLGDVDRTTLTVSRFVGPSRGRVTSTLPIDRVTSVWRDGTDGWSIALNGGIQIDAMGDLRFIP